jgi:primosomal replication protein N
MNRLVLSVQLVERGVMRYTPAGLPALNLSFKHESEVSENGQPRKVSMEIKAVGIGDITRPLSAMALGSTAHAAGFLAAARNGRGWLFHITEVDAVEPLKPAD